ncbi:chaperone required for assembly of F1-ATPase [Litorimonas taeanensis]|uniref:Chaperone required for assembly of F1-ATPase n=1 Tax=Litorimonas taeanensis TaxID=568099 RepID=A0A420WMD4_9PROT|nr:ATP12 family protein [Litorimonas taeanensis]RKQ72201.1 chaperone required for assembly of F1-ATPase [Litorimonas taeanensis]
MAKKNNKRFYKAVSTAPLGHDFVVKLDVYTLKTPGKKTLLLPSKALAEAVAQEWEAQGEHILPPTMPITRLTNVAIEQTPDNRPALIEEARRYAKTDLLCYRAPQPRILIERQNAQWDEWVSWAKERGVSLKTTQSLSAIEQAEPSLRAVEDYAANLDDIRLTLFVHFIAVFGSVILAMAVMEEAIEAGAAFDVSRLDALYQIELWGEDEEAAEISEALKLETTRLGQVLGMI